MAIVEGQGGKAEPAPPGDETARRVSVSHYREDAERLARLCERFGKDASSMVRYALELAEQSPRVYRHAVRQRTVTIEAIAEEVRLTWGTWPEGMEVYADLRKVAREITALFEPFEAPGVSGTETTE